MNFAAAGNSDGKIYVVGGTGYSSMLATVDVYDPTTNSWSTIPNLPTPRYSPSAAAMGGKLFVVGGYQSQACCGYVTAGTAEQFDPIAQTWTELPPLPTARVGAGLAAGGDGKLYAIGGITQVGSETMSTVVEAFDPSTQSWNSRAPMPVALSDLGVAAGGDGRIYALGQVYVTSAWEPQLEIYSPSTNLWTVMSTPPTAFSLTYYPMVVSGLDGRIYAFGLTASAYTPGTSTWTTLRPMPNEAYGDYRYLTFNAAARGGDGRIYLFPDVELSAAGTTVAVYDPTIDDWTPHASMPTPRIALAAVTTTDGRVYAIGGWIGLAPTGAVEQYLPPSDAWIQRASLPTPRGYLGAALTASNHVIAIGGDGSNQVVTNAVEEYDPNADVWTARAPLPAPLEGAGVATGADGNIYVVGGTTTTSPITSSVEVYDPAMNCWSSRSNMLAALEFVSLVAAPDGKLYAVGGFNVGGFSSNVEAYDPSTNQWSWRASLLPPARQVTAVLGSDGRIYAIGGPVSGLNYASRVDAYDPATDSWAQSTTLPIGTSYASAVTDGNDIFVIGGFNYSGGNGGILEHGCLCSSTHSAFGRRGVSSAATTVPRAYLPLVSTAPQGGCS